MKGNTQVILCNGEYNDKICNFTEEEKLSEISVDPAKRLQKAVNKYLTTVT
jgi:hypothetical protein